MAAFTKLKELRLVDMGLDGKSLRTRSERFRFRVDMVTFFAGQLPKELGKLVNLKEFHVDCNKIEGQLSIQSERFRVGVDMVTFVAGQLPKELGKLVNLRVFDVWKNNTSSIARSHA